MNRTDDVILDQEYLNAYTGGDTDLQTRILGLFSENAPMYLKCLAVPNNENWRADAHKLKGAARSIGAKRLASVAEKAEKLGNRRGNEQGKSELLKILRLHLEETLKFIKDQYL